MAAHQRSILSEVSVLSQNASYKTSQPSYIQMEAGKLQEQTFWGALKQLSKCLTPEAESGSILRQVSGHKRSGHALSRDTDPSA